VRKMVLLACISVKKATFAFISNLLIFLLGNGGGGRGARGAGGAVLNFDQMSRKGDLHVHLYLELAPLENGFQPGVSATQ
jgi:hypothetical protein